MRCRYSGFHVCTAVMHRYVGCCDALNLSASPAVEVVENHRLDGVVYFADEEGVYSLRFGAWPVPTISDGSHDVVLEGPVCKQNQVVGWHTSGDANKLQRFQVAMSGFAFNSTMLWDPRLRSHQAWNSIRHPEMVEQGFQVSSLPVFASLESFTCYVQIKPYSG